MAFFNSDKRPRGLRAPSLPGSKTSNGFPSRPNQFVASSSQGLSDEDRSPANGGNALPPRSSSRPLVGSDKQAPAGPAAAAAAIAPGPTPLPSPPSMATDKFAPSMATNIPNGRGVNGLSRSPNGITATGRAQPNSFAASTPPEDDLGINVLNIDDNDNVRLDDLIPDPESDSAGNNSSNRGLTPSQSDKQSDNSTTDSWMPPQPEPVAAPVTAIHLNCYQAHRHMAPSNNYWYPVPCMTCQKQDRETRYRCVFCCLRICGSCHQGLIKCEGRSLAAFMKNVR